MTAKKANKAKTPTITKKPSVRARLAAQAEALEQAVVKDQSDAKQGLNFSGETKQLLDRAIDMVCKNNGSAIPDPIGRAKVKGHSDLLTACKGKLHVAIEAIMAAASPEDLQQLDRRPARVFSLLTAVMKSAMFIASGRYHMWLNGRDAPLFAIRDETRLAPYGLEFRDDAMVDAYLATAIGELQAWFGGLCELVGWDLQEQPFPLTYDVDEAGEWFPVSDLDAAYEVVEKRAQAAKVRRIEREATARTKAVTEALAKIAAMEKAAA